MSLFPSPSESGSSTDTVLELPVLFLINDNMATFKLRQFGGTEMEDAEMLVDLVSFSCRHSERDFEYPESEQRGRCSFYALRKSSPSYTSSRWTKITTQLETRY